MQTEVLSNIQSLEERYDAENQLILAVSQGLVKTAETALERIRTLSAQNDSPDRFIACPATQSDSSDCFTVSPTPEKDGTPSTLHIQYDCIVLNTLLRKAVEQAQVHPFHIERLSSRFLQKITGVTSLENELSLQKEMIHKYCLLVKNHSMNEFSLLVQRVLTRIDSDLTADLTLKTQARLLNVNASYLSTLFKKETGMTLTDYVNKKRIDHAVFLLNTTDMQIQNIAQACGIPDVNYFTKLFKKYIGKTPKDYRGEIL